VRSTPPVSNQNSGSTRYTYTHQHTLTCMLYNMCMCICVCVQCATYKQQCYIAVPQTHAYSYFYLRTGVCPPAYTHAHSTQTHTLTHSHSLTHTLSDTHAYSHTYTHSMHTCVCMCSAPPTSSWSLCRAACGKQERAWGTAAAQRL